MPTIDGGWQDLHPRFPPPGPQAPQKQPKQTVSWAKAFLRTSEDSQLVMQGKSLEQEVSARRLRRSGRSTRPDHGSHRLVECRPATLTSMGFFKPDAILARHRYLKVTQHGLHVALKQYEETRRRGTNVAHGTKNVDLSDQPLSDKSFQ
jgi:hypothetical protein